MLPNKTVSVTPRGRSLWTAAHQPLTDQMIRNMNAAHNKPANHTRDSSN